MARGLAARPVASHQVVLLVSVMPLKAKAGEFQDTLRAVWHLHYFHVRPRFTGPLPAGCRKGMHQAVNMARMCQECPPDTFRLVSTQNLSDAARDISGMQPSCTCLSAGLGDRHPCNESHGVIAAVLLTVSTVLGSKGQFASHVPEA